jgi:hypothetical protein
MKWQCCMPGSRDWLAVRTFLAMIYCHTHPLLLEYGIDLGSPMFHAPCQHSTLQFSRSRARFHQSNWQPRMGAQASGHAGRPMLCGRKDLKLSMGNCTRLSAPAALKEPKDGTWQLASLDFPCGRQGRRPSLALQDGTSLQIKNSQKVKPRPVRIPLPAQSSVLDIKCKSDSCLHQGHV